MQKDPHISELTGSDHRCRTQFKGAQTSVFAGIGQDGLSYYCYDYYTCRNILETKNSDENSESRLLNFLIKDKLYEMKSQKKYHLPYCSW